MATEKVYRRTCGSCGEEYNTPHYYGRMCNDCKPIKKKSYNGGGKSILEQRIIAIKGEV